MHSGDGMRHWPRSTSDSYTIQAVRVDVTADCPFDQLSIFDTAAPAPARPGPTTSVEIG